MNECAICGSKFGIRTLNNIKFCPVHYAQQEKKLAWTERAAKYKAMQCVAKGP